MKLKNIQAGDTLIWRHRDADELKALAKSPRQLERSITVKAVFDEHIKTNFGDYTLANGCNTYTPCGCNRFCNCYGIVEQCPNDASR